MFLTLPSLSRAIPARFKFGGVSKNLLNLLSSMTDAGIVTEADLSNFQLPLCGEDLLKILEGSIRRNIGSSMSFKAIGTEFSLNINSCFYGDASPEIRFVVSGSSTNIVFIENLFTKLDTIHPGMGRFALNTLDNINSCGGFGMTPMGALGMCEYLYWQGESSDLAFQEVYGDEWNDGCDVVVKAEIFGGIPSKAYEVDPAIIPIMSREDACSLISKITNDVLKEFWNQIIFLNQITGDFLTEIAGDYEEGGAAFPAAIRWNESDNLARPMDDYFQCLAEGGASDMISYFVVDANIDGVNKMIEKIKFFSSVYSSLDASIAIIQDCQNELCN